MNSLIRQTHFHSARNVVCFWRHWNWWACLEKFPMKSVGIVSFYRDTASAQIQLLAQWTTFLPYIISKAKVSFVSKIFPDLWNVFRFQSAISISFLNFFFDLTLKSLSSHRHLYLFFRIINLASPTLHSLKISITPFLFVFQSFSNKSCVFYQMTSTRRFLFA